MSDEIMPPSPSAGQPETPEEIFARIQRRRSGALVTTAGEARQLPVQDDHPERLGSSPAMPIEARIRPDDAPLAQPRIGDEHQANDDFGPRRVSGANREMLPVLRSMPLDEGLDNGFPRSKTFRFLLRNPEITLLASLPLAHLLLRSPAIRRTALQLGRFTLRQQVWKQVRRFTSND